MELSIPIDFINPTNVYFVEKKKNIIVEGDFVKVVYSTDSFEMNGVYIAIDFCTFQKSACGIKSVPSSHRLWTEVNPENECEFRAISGREVEGDDTRRQNESSSDKSWIQIVNKVTQNRDFSSQKRADDTENTKIDISRNTKKIITFDPNSKDNKLLIEKLCKFEHDIIKRYIEENCPKKTATYILKNQLMTNTVKYHSENKELGKKTNNIERCILKVSGVWETATNVGITMKFTLVY